MNFNRRSPRAKPDPSRPSKVFCDTKAEVDAVLARADKLERGPDGKWFVARRGDYAVTAWDEHGPWTGNGGRNGQKTLHLSWHGDDAGELL